MCEEEEKGKKRRRREGGGMGKAPRCPQPTTPPHRTFFAVVAFSASYLLRLASPDWLPLRFHGKGACPSLSTFCQSTPVKQANMGAPAELREKRMVLRSFVPSLSPSGRERSAGEGGEFGEEKIAGCEVEPKDEEKGLRAEQNERGVGMRTGRNSPERGGADQNRVSRDFYYRSRRRRGENKRGRGNPSS